jgi:hypothetical protein
MDDAKAIVVTQGLNLSYTQISKINHYIMEVGIGMGVVFIHKITASDVEKNQMVITFFNRFCVLFVQLIYVSAIPFLSPFSTIFF